MLGVDPNDPGQKKLPQLNTVQAIPENAKPDKPILTHPIDNGKRTIYQLNNIGTIKWINLTRQPNKS